MSSGLKFSGSSRGKSQGSVLHTKSAKFFGINIGIAGHYFVVFFQQSVNNGFVNIHLLQYEYDKVFR